MGKASHLLCMLVTLAACSFDASKLRAVPAPQPDGAAASADTSDPSWAGTGGATGQPDTHISMGGSGGSPGQADGGDSNGAFGPEVRPASLDGGVDGFIADSSVLDEGADGAAQDMVAQPDTGAQADAANQQDGVAQPDTAAQPDTGAQADAASQQDGVVQPDAMLAPDVATAPDLAAPDTAVNDAGLADAPSPMFCNPADPDLVACYRFEGNASDESAYANHGSARNVSYVTGAAGQAVRTSINSDIAVPDSTSLSPANAITIELWVRPQSTLASGRAGVVDNQDQYGLFVYPGNAITCTAAGGSVSASSVLSTTGWTHVACVYDGTNLRLYRNGTQVGSSPQTGRLVTTGTSGMSVGHNNPTGDAFDGAIDGLRIWRVARPVGLLCTQPSDCG